MAAACPAYAPVTTVIDTAALTILAAAVQHPSTHTHTLLHVHIHLYKSAKSALDSQLQMFMASSAPFVLLAVKRRGLIFSQGIRILKKVYRHFGVTDKPFLCYRV